MENSEIRDCGVAERRKEINTKIEDVIDCIYNEAGAEVLAVYREKNIITEDTPKVIKTIIKNVIEDLFEVEICKDIWNKEDEKWMRKK